MFQYLATKGGTKIQIEKGDPKTGVAFTFLHRFTQCKLKQLGTTTTLERLCREKKTKNILSVNTIRHLFFVATLELRVEDSFDYNRR